MLLASALAGFSPAASVHVPSRGAVRSAVYMAEPEDPTANPFIQAINSFQEALQTSPVAKFKAQFAKMQAGDYDSAATAAKLESLIADTPCVMFSFST